MKKANKIMSNVLALGMLGGVAFGVVGCGGKGGTEGVLSIAAFEGGNGNLYATELANAFKKYHPDIDVSVLCDPTVPESAATALESKSSNVDVYMVNGVNIGTLCENSQGALMNLNDVFSSKPKTSADEGEKTIEQLIDAHLLPSMKYGGDFEEYAGNYYAIPTGSNPVGLVLNVSVLNDVLGEGNWSEPRTTNELIALCDAIQLADEKVQVGTEQYQVYPMIYAGNAVEYWRYLWYCWQAQYDGAETFHEAQACKIDGAYNKDAYFSNGKAKAMNVLETLIARTNDYCHPDSMSNKHTVSQKYFMQGRAAMMVTGDWIENETGTEYTPDLKMIKAPILSDLADKLALTGTATEKDNALAEIVSKIDAGETSDSRLDVDKFTVLASARQVVFTLANSQIAVIPSTSVNADLAKDFLRFMYSKEGFEIFLTSTKGSRLPVADYTVPDTFVSTMTTFGKSVKAIADTRPQYIYTNTNDPIRFRAGLEEFISSEQPEVAMGKSTGAVSASAYLTTEKGLLDNMWSALMSQVQ